MDWDWQYTWDEVLPALLDGLVVTLEVTVLAFPLALVLGLVLTMLRRSRRWYVRHPVRWVIEFIRSTPPLVQLFFVFYAVPLLIGLRLSALVTGVVVLGIHYAAYLSEVYRAGIDAVPRGQWEAATALNIARAHTWRSIVLPQAIPPVIPALGNYWISLFKDTPTLLAIGLLEILTQAQRLGASDFKYVEAITMAGLMFLVLAYGSSLLVRYLERRYGTVERVV
ncbi:MAG TPA: ectoine/hydroxyectoine ABC transporter permease subunit EhuD [Jiangellaceae bacterium]